MIITISGGAVQVAVLHGLPAERGTAKSKGDHDGSGDDDDDENHDDHDHHHDEL